MQPTALRAFNNWNLPSGAKVEVVNAIESYKSTRIFGNLMIHGCELLRYNV